MKPSHFLKHATFSDGSLTPACACGWYSPTRSHSDFERHLREVNNWHDLDPQSTTEGETQ